MRQVTRHANPWTSGVKTSHCKSIHVLPHSAPSSLGPGRHVLYISPYKSRQCTVYIIELISTPGLNVLTDLRLAQMWLEDTAYMIAMSRRELASRTLSVAQCRSKT